MLVREPDGFWTGWVAIWADWSIHIPFTLNFAYRPFPITTNPHFAGTPFRYHYAADMLSGLLMKAGLPFIPSMLLPSILASWLLLATVLLWYRVVWRHRATSWLATLLFFGNGGLGFLWYITSQLGITPALTPSNDLVQFTRMEEYGIRWVSFITAEFIPQRAFLLGVPLALLVLIPAHRYITRRQTPAVTQLVFMGLLTGIMPLVHIYSYLVIMGTICLQLLLYRPPGIRRWIAFILPAVTGWLSITFGIFGGLPTGDFRFEPGWLATESLPQWLWFWIKNIGVMIILIPLAIFRAPAGQRKAQLPLLLLFIIANLWVFQEVSWDNRKFLLYWYLAAAGFVAHWCIRRLSVTNQRRTLIVVLLVYLAIFSGLLDFLNLFRYQAQKYPLFSAETYDLAAEVRQKTRPDAVFLTAPTNTYMGMTLGRQILMGYSPWLENYGYSVQERREDIKRMFAGGEEARPLLRKYGVTHIVVSEPELELMPGNWIREAYPEIAGTASIKVYAVTD